MLHLAERTPRVRNVAVHTVKLGVVPNVEDIAAELHEPTLAEFGLFIEAHVPVVDARATADRTRSIADGAGGYGRVREEIRIENESVVLSDILCVERSGKIRLAGELEQVRRVQFFDVVLRSDTNRE